MVPRNQREGVGLKEEKSFQGMSPVTNLLQPRPTCLQVLPSYSNEDGLSRLQLSLSNHFNSKHSYINMGAFWLIPHIQTITVDKKGLLFNNISITWRSLQSLLKHNPRVSYWLSIQNFRVREVGEELKFFVSSNFTDVLLQRSHLKTPVLEGQTRPE